MELNNQNVILTLIESRDRVINKYIVLKLIKIESFVFNYETFFIKIFKCFITNKLFFSVFFFKYFFV